MLWPAVLVAQTEASLALGTGTVRFPGGSKQSAIMLTPAVELDLSQLTASLQGTLASLPGGIWSEQGRANAWVASPALLGRLRAGFQVRGTGTTRNDGTRSASAHGVAELLWAAPTWGVALGAGPSGGWIRGAPWVRAFHARARAWARIDAADYALTVEPTHFLGAWFTDVSAGMALSTGAVKTSLWGGARISPAFGSKGAASVSLQLFPLSRVAVELSGGSYLPEPYEGFPRGGFVAAGLRVFTTARHHAVTRPAQAVWPPLVPGRRGDSVVVRFRMDGARSVAIAGSWDDWRTHALRPLGRDLWEGTLRLRSGTYRFTLLVDGTDWVVPSGVAVRRGKRGGLVALLAVP